MVLNVTLVTKGFRAVKEVRFDFVHDSTILTSCVLFKKYIFL